MSGADITYAEVKAARKAKAERFDDWHNSGARNEAIRAGVLRHSLLHDDYVRALYRANYYGWAARRGFVAAGGDPYDGRPAKVRQYDRVSRAEGVVVHKAQARFWLAQAAALRAKMQPVLP